MNRTMLSRNNPFLKEIGVIEGKNKKKVSGIGAKLGRAFEHHQDNDVRTFLREIISQNSILSNLITTLRIKKGMSVDDFINHIMYVSGEKDTKENRTGSRTIIELLTMSGLVTEDGGNLQVAKGSALDEASSKIIEEKLIEAKIEKPAEKAAPGLKGDKDKKLPLPAVTINIQLQLPESDNPDVYKNLFTALRKHLINGE